MRIAPEQIANAVQTIRQRLGDVPVWLFGSRVDDAAKGGDIDLYVELPQPASPLVVARTRGDLAAFRVRFAEYQEHSGKLLKAIALEEGVALVGMADVLAFAEKAHLIDSADFWRETMKLGFAGHWKLWSAPFCYG